MYDKELEQKLYDIWKNKEQIDYEIFDLDTKGFKEELYKYGYTIGSMNGSASDEKLFHKEELFMYYLYRGGVQERAFSIPMSNKYIINYLDISKERVSKILNRFDKDKWIEKVSENTINDEKLYKFIGSEYRSKNNYKDFKQEYIARITEKQMEIQNEIQEKIQKSVLELGNIKEENKNIKEDLEEVKKTLNNIYANILTMMGIFIALFSFITINFNFFINMSKNYSIFELSILAVSVNLFLLIVIKSLFSLIRDFRETEKNTKRKWRTKNGLEIIVILMICGYMWIATTTKEYLNYSEKVIIAQSRFVDKFAANLVIDGKNGKETQSWIKACKKVLGYDDETVEIPSKFLDKIKNMNEKDIRMVKEYYEKEKPVKIEIKK